MKVLMISGKVATVKGKPLIYEASPVLTLGTIGCGSLFAFMDGKLLDIGDGDTEKTLTIGNATIELNALPEVNYYA